MKRIIILNVSTLLFLTIASCTPTPEQQFRDRMEKTPEEELLKELFDKPKVYKVIFRDFMTDDLKGYSFNESLHSKLMNGATVQVIFDGDRVLYIGNDKFVGSFKGGYYSADNGRYQVSILSKEAYEAHPTIIKKVYSINGVEYNRHRNLPFDPDIRILYGVKPHPAMKSNVIVVKDSDGFVGDNQYLNSKTSTIVFESLDPIGYYDGPRDKK